MSARCGVLARAGVGVDYYTIYMLYTLDDCVTFALMFEFV